MHIRDPDPISAASSDRADRRIAQATEERLTRAAAQPAAIAAELTRIDREWDVERALMANAGTLALMEGVLALAVDRRFAAVPAIVGAILVQHAVQGWCPPLPVLRSIGFRSPREQAVERAALLALRGDLAPTDPSVRPREKARCAMAAAEGHGAP